MRDKVLEKCLEIVKVENKKEKLKKQIENIIKKENLKVDIFDYPFSIVIQKADFDGGLNFCIAVEINFNGYIEIDFPTFEDLVKETKQEFEKYGYTLIDIHDHFETKHLHFRKNNIDIDFEELKFLMYNFL